MNFDIRNYSHLKQQDNTTNDTRLHYNYDDEFILAKSTTLKLILIIRDSPSK